MGVRAEYSAEMDIWTATWGPYAGTGDTEAEAREDVDGKVLGTNVGEAIPEGWRSASCDSIWVRDQCDLHMRVEVISDIQWSVTQLPSCQCVAHGLASTVTEGCRLAQIAAEGT